jgi:hypothetical protein
MIFWIVSVITLILLSFVCWQFSSKSFRERCEAPKFIFLETLGIRSPRYPPSATTSFPKEKNHGIPHS